VNNALHRFYSSRNPPQRKDTSKFYFHTTTISPGKDNDCVLSLTGLTSKSSVSYTLSYYNEFKV
jgi:hypothetical protein